LIEFILRHTLPRRGIKADPDEVLVTMGAQNALWLSANVLLNQRRTAALENPCYPSLRDILTQSRCQVASVEVDSSGLPPDALPADVDVVFTTPSHQCPTATTMPLERRQALLQQASEKDFLIVEDDYEFEMSFLKAPSPALKSLDREGRVIYVGSFSKSLFPGLRLGYLVGSKHFIREARALRSTVLRHPPGHIQRTAAYFLSLGHYDALIRRMGTAFHERRLAMEDAFLQHGLAVAGQGAFGGSSFWMRASARVDTEEVAERLRGKGVLIEPGRPFFTTEEAPKNYYRLAYSSLRMDKIADGVALIASEMHEP
jgi:GntR family transcriptional regulator/MocR family aminotransferase